MKIASHTDFSSATRTWQNFGKENFGLLKLEDFEKKNNEDNKYYFPDFIDYFATNLLPTIALWSHILWGDLSRYNAGRDENKWLILGAGVEG